MEFGSISLKNYVNLMDDWFDDKMDKYNFYLMPLSFFDDNQAVESLGIENKDSLNTGIKSYLSQKEKENPYNENSRFGVSAKIELKFVKSNTEGIPSVKLSNDPDAIKVRLTSDKIKQDYPLTYKDMVDKCKELLSDIKINPKFHSIKSDLQKNQKLFIYNYLDPDNKKSQKQGFYNENFSQLLIEKYKQTN